jgi:stringent starvation protein B
VLNIGTAATNQLMLGNEEIQFQARFSGAVFSVLVPVDAVAAIYASENGQGMAFDVEPIKTDDSQAEQGQASLADSSAPDGPPEPKPSAAGRSHLTRIK